jgi:class 3 adenylate cyclase/predicted ATPase
MDVAMWLRGLGLEQYAQVFRDNDIDGEILSGMTAEDLKELGISSFGHRRRLLNAITVLGRGPPTRDVAQSATSVISPPTSPPLIDAERRQLTVMFCDLVGSTALSSRLDPEDLREVIAAYHRAVTDVVRSFDGFVAKYMGDGVLVYFGYPQAHEDDAERAVRAGLGTIDAVGRLDVQSVRLQIHIGIATGLVVVGELVGEGSAQEQSAVGETLNLAARLQTLAEPNGIVIAASTRRLVGDLFEYLDLGAVEVKGFAGPIPAWQVLRPSALASRFEALHGTALTRLVGRDEELELLLRRWARTKAGNGQVVLISGEPGIGKSRLVAELARRLEPESHIRLRYFCSPYSQDSALHPVIDQLGRAASFARDDPPATKLEKLEALLAQAQPPEEDVALLIDLLSLPGSERYPLPSLSPQRKKDRTLQALIRQLEGLARRQPVVLVLEDAHWMDPTSRELFDLSVERVRSLPGLLIITFRPEFQPPWIGQPQVTVLALNRLDRRDQTAMVEQIAGGKALPDEIVAQIVDHTDGVPLFVEELTKSVLEGGLLREEAERYVLDRALPPLAIPTSLHDSLIARLDRLAPMRLVAQIGAAIGRQFSYPLLHAVSRLPEKELRDALARLVASELVFQRGTPPNAVYSFKHVLVQDAAHGSLLRSTRQQLHARIAEVLETHSPELMDSQPEILAHHYAEAGLVEKSISYWEKAGHNSAARSAMAEAAAQFQKGLDQLALLQNGRERQQQELEFNSALGGVMIAHRGYAAPETSRTYERARELCELLGSPSQFLRIPYGQAVIQAARGELDLALRSDEELLNLSRRRNDSSGLVLGLLSYGRDLLFSGSFPLSRSPLEEVLAIYNPISHHSLVRQAGIHPHVNAQAALGVVLLCLGFLDQALALSNTSIAEARRLAHPPTLASSLAWSTRFLSLSGNHVALGERVDELVAVTAEHGFPHWAGPGNVCRGWVKVQNGDLVEGIELMQSGSAAYHATGANTWMPHFLSLRANACEFAGQSAEARALFDEALRIVERTGERWFEAELNRHKGQLLLRQGDPEAAEQRYRKAISIAHEQEAKLWELRAAVSLARLRRDQSRRAEARDLLAPVYGWFSEGFGTPDLKEGKALLDELT